MSQNLVSFKKIAKLTTPSQFSDYLRESKIVLPFTEQMDSTKPYAEKYQTERCGLIGNRFCILPMEGWDGTPDGRPTELTKLRWKNFGISGAKLIWGGEAVAVTHAGRANPNQLLLNEKNVGQIAELRKLLQNSHQEVFGSTDDLSLGLQLTHSGRFARPNHKQQLEPRTVYPHPILDKKFSTQPADLLTDSELRQIIGDFVKAARLAADAGFDWIDIKHCHGYLGHELLSGYDRQGDFGGSFENRTRFLREIVSGVNAIAPQLGLGVRVSIFDFIPFIADKKNLGSPAHAGDYKYAWGGDGSGVGIELSEPSRFMELLKTLGIELICTTAGSPYYNPHIQRPAMFPPSDGYLPPEDPLVGVARQIQTTADLKALHPDLFFVGSGYSYLQQWLPHVGLAALQKNMVDSVGLGRMVLSYPEMPADILAKKILARKKICRTYSDCTTAPRNGLVSGCYPLDHFYRKRPEFKLLNKHKRER